MSHTFPDGSERPVAFTSRTLNNSEKNYSQIEKEAPSLVYGINGRRFMLVTDHQPLVSILGPKKGIPPLAAARMQRWALILSAYSYDISYRATGAHANTDDLSRLPLKTLSVVPSSKQSILDVLQIKALPVKAGNVATASRRDLVLSMVHRYLKDGWPREVPEPLIPYARKRKMS